MGKIKWQGQGTTQRLDKSYGYDTDFKIGSEWLFSVVKCEGYSITNLMWVNSVMLLRKAKHTHERSGK